MNEKNDASEATLAKTDEETGPLRFLDCDDGAIMWSRPIAESGAAAARTLGVEDTGTLASRLMTQVAKTMSPLVGSRPKAADLDDAAQLLEGIGPQDSVEGMLAVQMVAAHDAAMRCLARATHPDQTSEGVELNFNRATKLMRVYTAQLEALNRHRSKASQTVVVKHVHVNEGGQAIVGNVEQGSGGRGAK